MSALARTPGEIAADIVDRFSWSSNVMHEGRLVGQQHVVAIAIADAIIAERLRYSAAQNTARGALCDATIALIGVSQGRLKPAGRVITKTIEKAKAALEETWSE